MDRYKWRIEAAKEDLEVFSKVDQSQMDEMTEEIKKAKTVYVAGFGRAGLHGKILSMNLSQLGRLSYVVGDTAICTPSIHEGDLLVVNSFSGETKTIAVIAQCAKEAGARVVLVSSDAESTIGKIADVNVVVPIKLDYDQDTGWWPFYTVSTWIMNAVREYIMWETGQSGLDLMYYHNNME